MQNAILYRPMLHFTKMVNNTLANNITLTLFQHLTTIHQQLFQNHPFPTSCPVQVWFYNVTFTINLSLCILKKQRLFKKVIKIWQTIQCITYSKPQTSQQCNVWKLKIKFQMLCQICGFLTFISKFGVVCGIW